MINWTKPMLERFKVAYQHARQSRSDWFVFDGNKYVTNYAKYLIEYLDGRLQ